jgi:hypothetical protein
VNLNKHVDVEIVRLASDSREQWADRASNSGVDLIVLGMSSPASEPVVALSRASLVGCVGQIPLLIISNRPFEPEDRIVHLDFPFDIDDFDATVTRLLQEAGQSRPVSG